jgi:TFA2 Winged helix domain 2
MHLVNKVLECLRAAAPESLDAAEVAEKCGVDLTTDAELAQLVASNPKTLLGEDGKYAYRAQFAVTCLEEVEALLRSRPEGTSLKALAESYPGAAADAEELVQSGRVWGIDNKEMGDRTFFPRDASYEVQVDDQLRRIWARMEVPSAPHLLAAELRRAGITPAARSWVRAPREAGGAGGKKGKRKRDFSKLHVTNVHLWDELFAPGAGEEFDDED